MVIYKQPSIYKSGDSNTLSLNLNDYEYRDVTNEITFETGFNKRNSPDQYARYYKELGILTVYLIVYKNSSITANSWTPLFSLTDNEFYFSDYIEPKDMPIGVFGGSITKLSIGIRNDGITQATNKNIVLTTFLNYPTNKIGYKDIVINEANYGALIENTFVVSSK